MPATRNRRQAQLVPVRLMAVNCCTVMKIARNRLNVPDRKFVRAGELPTPRGFAKGVGNGTPINPQLKCGRQLRQNRARQPGES